MFEVDGVTQVFWSRSFDVAIVNAINLIGSVQLPSVDARIGPRPSFIGLLVDLDFAAHQSQEGHFTIIEWSA